MSFTNKGHLKYATIQAVSQMIKTALIGVNMSDPSDSLEWMLMSIPGGIALSSGFFVTLSYSGTPVAPTGYNYENWATMRANMNGINIINSPTGIDLFCIALARTSTAGGGVSTIAASIEYNDGVTSFRTAEAGFTLTAANYDAAGITTFTVLRAFTGWSIVPSIFVSGTGKTTDTSYFLVVKLGKR